MPTYSPEIVESVLHQYVHTDKPVGEIARDHKMDPRDVTRIRHAARCPARRLQARAIPPAMALFQDTMKRLMAAAPPRASSKAAASPDLSAARETAPPPADALALDRIERLVEQELAAQEATRAQLGLLARTPVEAERSVRILSTSIQILLALARLRGDGAPHREIENDDDMPDDIDDFRNELARRIRAFVASRTG